ncbi:MAG: hypothetical protein Q8N55_04780 [bacterium]|nr:hypothetical protein [bacterium]
MKKQFFSVVIAVLFGLFLAGNVSAIGMVTEPIVLKDVLRGQTIPETITLLNSQNLPTFYELGSEGKIEGWVKFYLKEDANLENPLTKIEVPANGFFELIAVFKVPQEGRNGLYKGSIVLWSAPGDEEAENSVQIRQRIEKEVTIEITDKEIIKLNSQIIPLTYEVNQGKPLNIKVIYENQGNVEVKPSVELTVTKNESNVFKAVFPYPENEIAVKPLERKVFDPLLTWQTQGQAAGPYLIKVKVLLGDEIIQEENFSLNVLAFSERIMAFVAKIGFGSVGLGWFLIGLLFVLLALNLAIISKKPQLFQKIFKLKSRLIKENNN